MNAGIATVRPPAVVSSAWLIPSASSSGRPIASDEAIALNARIMPSTVPSNPSSGLIVAIPTLLLGNLLSFATVAAAADGIDVSVVAQAMEDMGAGSVLYPILYTGDVVLANGIVLVLGLLASLSPAWRASRYDPIRALNKV